MEEKRLILLGFMGTGKSSVAQVLANKLKLDVIDTDELIVEKAGMTINKIFSNFGEKYFRKLETEVLQDIILSSDKSHIVSTGGGIVLKEENWQLLRSDDFSFTISLMALPETIYERVKGDNSRPLLRVNDPYQKICELLEKRKDLYLKADFVIWTDNLTTEEVADKIISVTGMNTFR